MPNLLDVTVPVGQSEGTESVVSTWFKAIGELVQENEPLLEISTDKVNMEVASPGTGRLVEILKTDGTQVEPGEVLGRLDTDITTTHSIAEIVPPEAQPQADGLEKSAAKGGSSDLSPAVRKLIKEHNVDASAISGTGKGGRITADDVLKHVEAQRASSLRDIGHTRGAEAQRIQAQSHRVQHNQMRRSIAQHMVQSVAAAPHVTSVFDADLSAVVAHRDANKAEFERRGAKLTYTAYFVKAAVDAIKAVPEANSRWHDDALEIYDDINIGIATALEDGGLIVPVIANAQDLDLYGIAARLQDLTERARTENLEPRDVQGGTFTISNHGVSGSLFATPIIINQPQSSILGVGKLERRVVPAGDSGSDVEIKPMCYVTLTIDHRVLDGYQANQFLTAWVKSVSSF
jgi:2-oxoglutarate dehydrogenase E2 component (dihydrolipoamide succinyltransferase)